MKSPLIIAATASLGLACLKLLAFSLTGSMIVLSSFFDSTVDSVVSLINHQVFKYARIEADDDHPFGHGGAEVVAAAVQGAIILILGLYVMYESGLRLLYSEDISESKNILIASGVMVFSHLVVSQSRNL